MIRGRSLIIAGSKEATGEINSTFQFSSSSSLHQLIYLLLSWQQYICLIFKLTLAFVQGSNWLLAFLIIQTSQVTPLTQTCTSPFHIEDYKYFKHELFVLCILTAMQINIKHMPRERLKKESLNLKWTNNESK